MFLRWSGVKIRIVKISWLLQGFGLKFVCCSTFSVDRFKAIFERRACLSKQQNTVELNHLCKKDVLQCYNCCKSKRYEYFRISILYLTRRDFFHYLFGQWAASKWLQALYSELYNKRLSRSNPKLVCCSGQQWATVCRK